MNNHKNLEIIINLLKSNNLDQIVINPGGTNQTLVAAIQNDPFFQCYSVVDERSAVYFAIGLYLQKRKPIVMSCTSAQATRNYIPGLTEAFYKKVPILAITMCKHPRFTYQGYMQAPDQISLPDDCVKKSFMLPCVSDINDEMHSIRVTNEAILELTRNGNGPIQLCCPWLDFPLKEKEVEFRTIKRIGVSEINSLTLNSKNVLVCVGEHLPFDDELKQELEKFCEKYNAVVYTNHLSNYHGKYAIQGNIKLLTVNFEFFLNKLKPDVLITIGGQTGDYPFYNLFSRNDITGLEHWSVSTDGSLVDTYDKLTTICQMSEFELFKAFNLNKSSADTQNHDFYETWSNLFDSTVYDVKVPFSAVSIAQTLSKQLPQNSIIQFSILNSLRIWNMFKIDSSIECYSNVGAFGIDGGLSTLIGQSVATNKLSFMIIGDLAFLYDMNSIALRHIKSNLRILLINNDGGIEFKLWGGDKKNIDKYIAAAGHFKNAKGWADTCGFIYLSATNNVEFEANIQAFIGNSSKPILLEVFVSDADEKKAYSDILCENKELALTQKAKRALKKIIR